MARWIVILNTPICAQITKQYISNNDWWLYNVQLLQWVWIIDVLFKSKELMVGGR